MKQLTKEQAIAFGENKCYEGMTPRQIAEFQLMQDYLCVPFDIFHKAVSDALGRAVYTHEFADREALLKELNGEKEPPTLEDIIGLIPEDKSILILKELLLK